MKTSRQTKRTFRVVSVPFARWTEKLDVRVEAVLKDRGLELTGSGAGFGLRDYEFDATDAEYQAVVADLKRIKIPVVEG